MTEERLSHPSQTPEVDIGHDHIELPPDMSDTPFSDFNEIRDPILPYILSGHLYCHFIGINS